MAWVGDAIYSLGTSLVVGVTCNCPESPETVQRDLRELGPSALLGAAAHLGEHADRAAGRAADASWLKRRVVRVLPRASPSARELLQDRRQAGARYDHGSATALGEFLVYGPVRDQLGLRNARWCLTGGAPLGRRHLPLLPLVRRQPEAGLRRHRSQRAGLAAGRRRGRPQHASAAPLPGIEVRIGERGEVLVQGPGVFKGYYKQDEATRDAIDAGRLAQDRRCRPRSIRAAIWPSSTAPRTWASSPTARRSRRSSSRTSSSSAPTSARRWPSATSGRSWRR